MSREPEANTGMHCAQELLDLATVDLYRNNLFRVLGVPVNAGPVEVRQQLKKLEMQRKLGLAASAGSAGPLPLSPPPDSGAMEQAMERLTDPVARMLDELFWFFAQPDDEGFRALERGDIAAARSIWKRASSANTDSVAAKHDLAVLEHVLALEHADGVDQVSAALTAWKSVVDDEAFWSRIKARVSELDDVRLTTGFVRRIRETLPGMLLLVQARQAVAESERNHADRTSRLLVAIRQSPFEAALAEEAIREALKPLRNRLTAAVTAARARWKESPRHGVRIARELHESMLPLLAVYDRVAGDDLARQVVHDELAEAMNYAEVAYCKATNDWAGGAKLLELAQQVAKGEQLRTLIADNIRIDKENTESGNDWCAPGYWDLPDETVAELESARSQAEAGDFDRALDILLSMDASVGNPLKRAAAYCLSVRSIRAYNQALGDYQAIRPMVKKIMDKLPNSWRVPSPETPSFMMPPCLACASTYYTAWVKFGYGGQQNMFMCSSCSAEDDRTIAKRKAEMCGALQEILDYLDLAIQLDPKDPGIRRNRDGITKSAKEFGHSGSGSAGSLKKKLARDRVSHTDVAAVGSPTDTCFFCGQRRGVAAAALAVPMCSPATETKFLFGKGTHCELGDVIVPRCGVCRGHHADLPVRIEAWHDAALDAGDLRHFEKEKSALAGIRRSLAANSKKQQAATEAIERAKAALQSAVESQGVFGRLLRRPNPARDAAAKELAIAQQRHAEADAQVHHATAQERLATTELQELREQAVAAYRNRVPQPTLPLGMRPEGDLLHSPEIVANRKRSWKFGDDPHAAGEGVAMPRGTVAREPQLRAFDDKSQKKLSGAD